MHDAFTAALERWPRDGVPANPRAWLVSTGRFKAIDALRRRARFDASLARARRAARGDAGARAGGRDEDDGLADDRLRLIFTCCHPALTPDAQHRAHAARGLRAHDRGDRARVPDLRSDRGPADRPSQGARSAMHASPTRCPPGPSCPTGSTACCRSSTSSSTRATPPPRAQSLTRHDLSAEAIRLGRLLLELLPEHGARGRRAARADAAARVAAGGAHHARRRARPARRAGSLALGSGHRSRKGPRWCERALATRGVGPYTLQAAIAAVHAEAADAAATDWAQIVGLYDVLLRPSRRRSSSSTAPRRWPCATARRPASR